MLGASGGPDGMAARLLNHISKLLPNLVLAAIKEITLVKEKPDNLSKRLPILIKSIIQIKGCH